MKLIQAVIKPFQLDDTVGQWSLFEVGEDQFLFAQPDGTETLLEGDQALLLPVEGTDDAVVQSGRPLLIIAEDIEGEAIAATVEDPVGKSLLFFEDGLPGDNFPWTQDSSNTGSDSGDWIF